MGIGRFLDKFFIEAEGLVKSRDRQVFAGFDGDNFQMSPGIKVADGPAVTGLFRTTYTWNMGAITAMAIGSTDTIITQDVAMSGAAIGDVFFASPTASINALVGWDVACYSAEAVKLRAWYNGSITLTPGNVPFKIVCMKL